jgi:deoxycytidylate deaminase
MMTCVDYTVHVTPLNCQAHLTCIDKFGTELAVSGKTRYCTCEPCTWCEVHIVLVEMERFHCYKPHLKTMNLIEKHLMQKPRRGTPI